MTTNQTIDGVPLLPCPFCGGEPYAIHDHYVHDDLSPMPCVECRSCSAHLKAEDWNRRVQPAPVVVVFPNQKAISALVTKAARQTDLINGANYYTAAELAAEAVIDEVTRLTTK